MNTATNTASKKAVKSQSVTKSVNVYEGEDNAIIHVFDLSEFTKGIGQMVAKVQSKATFTYLGKKFILPSLTANNSNPERAANVFKQLVANFFPATEDRTETLKQGSDEYAAILSLQKVGFKFKTVSKVAVKEAIDTKLKNWKAKMNVQKEETRGLNAGIIAETKVLNVLVKEMRADNLAAITGFEKKLQSKLNAPIIDQVLPAN